ncbi:XRE family transcriptional regulator [Salibacterium salarium]|uniref:XRE family transcriptional regulator n=1 Tax=Salibacterium salarium TaxID=284579 RepID=A0A3R9WSH2_9BACI|nr:helix-turn-helix transcriptional regulator [Salibacterium salarium]RSL32636.1 XRE family transcriptional regulator [Salibacterium salarium]
MHLTLKQARLIKEKTQQELADSMGVHVHTYARMEKNPDEVTIREAKQLSELLGVDYDKIFFNGKSTLSR